MDDTSFADAKHLVETALAFVKTLTREQVDGAEDKTIAWTAGGNERKMKGRDDVQQFALPNFYFFVTTAYDILRHRGVPVGKRDYPWPSQLALMRGRCYRPLMGAASSFWNGQASETGLRSEGAAAS